MTKERLEGLIEIFCDADRRAKLTEEEREKYCPTIADVLEGAGECDG